MGRALGMNGIRWRKNKTAERAGAAGAISVSKVELFRQSEILNIHVVLSERTKGMVGEAELALMKPTSRLINTSRGPVVNDEALIKVLQARKIAGAALDVFDVEPLPADHPYRSLDNVLGAPHIAYRTEA